MFGTVEQVESHLCVKSERGDPRNVSKVDKNFTKVINKDLFSGEFIVVVGKNVRLTLSGTTKSYML